MNTYSSSENLSSTALTMSPKEIARINRREMARLNRNSSLFEKPNYQSLSACSSPTPSITVSSTDSPRASIFDVVYQQTT